MTPDELPRRRRRRRPTPWTTYLGIGAAVLAALVVVGVAIDASVTSMGVVPNLPGAGSLPGVAGLHPAGITPLAPKDYELADVHDPLEKFTSKLGPGAELPRALWPVTAFKTPKPPGQPARDENLANALAQQPLDEVGVVACYQWGAGDNRLVVATYRGRAGDERIFAKFMELRAATVGEFAAQTRYPFMGSNGKIHMDYTSR
jgi:hypothetical protein